MKPEKNHPHNQLHLRNSIVLYNAPIFPFNYYPSIILELLVAVYFCILIYLNLSNSMSNLRVVLYALLYFINQCLSNLISIEDSVDKLGLFPMKNLLMHMRMLVRANMLYLLVRLLINTYSLSAIVLLVLFIIDYLYKLRNIRKQKNSHSPSSSHLQTAENGLSTAKIIQFSNPILVYSLSKTMYGELTELSILFLVFFSLNLIITSELRQLLLFDRCNIFGWKGVIVQENTQQNGAVMKIQNIWDKKEALRSIIMASAVALAIENFLLIFESVKQEICLVIVHTLLIGIMAQILEFKIFGTAQNLLNSLLRNRKKPKHANPMHMSIFSI